MTYKLNIIFSLLMLGGCGCCGNATIRPFAVEMPVAVSCGLQPVKEPDWNLSHLDGSAATQVKLKAELEDLALARGYIGELEAELSSCE